MSRFPSGSPNMAPERVRLFLGLVLVQTVQSHPMAGTPTLVPVPSKIICPLKSIERNRFSTAQILTECFFFQRSVLELAAFPKPNNRCNLNSSVLFHFRFADCRLLKIERMSTRMPILNDRFHRAWMQRKNNQSSFHKEHPILWHENQNAMISQLSKRPLTSPLNPIRNPIRLDNPTSSVGSYWLWAGLALGTGIDHSRIASIKRFTPHSLRIGPHRFRAQKVCGASKIY